MIMVIKTTVIYIYSNYSKKQNTFRFVQTHPCEPIVDKLSTVLLWQIKKRENRGQKPGRRDRHWGK